MGMAANQKLADRLISVDDHVQEHPAVWTDRMSKTVWGDRIPHLEEDGSGGQFWLIDGVKSPLGTFPSAGALSRDRALGPKRWEDVPRAAYEPKERIKAMKSDGVKYSVLYPSVAGIAGERFVRLKDLKFGRACIEAYNDWLIEEWATSDPCFIPQCIVPMYPVDSAVSEIKRSVNKGHKGVVFPIFPTLLRGELDIAEEDYEPVWSVCEELGIPLCLHAGGNTQIQFPAYSGFSDTLVDAFQSLTRPLSSSFTVATTLLSGALLSHPGLRVIFTDCPIGWGRFILETLDYLSSLGGSDTELSPSELFRRQCHFTVTWERVDLTGWKHLGPENLLWASHFPLAISTWPDSRTYTQLNLGGLLAEDRKKIVYDNAESIYRLH